jgi:oxygen-dependent protoporphyrinogen oxidase
VVAGAGFAGLAAGFRLATAGHRVSLLERAHRAGGRAASAPDGEAECDPIAARVSAADRALLGLVGAAGLAGELLPLRPEVGAQLEGARLAPVDGGARRAARAAGVPLRQSLRLVRLPRLLRRYAPQLDAAHPERAADLDDRSIRDFGELYFGARVVDGWIEPWLAERAPVDEREASRASFLLRWAAESGDAAGALRAPPGLLAEALAARLHARTGCAVEGVEAGAAGRLRVHVAGDDGAAALDADAVVLGVPAPEARRLAAPLLVRAECRELEAVAYDPALTWRGRVRHVPVSIPTRLRVPRRSGAPFASIALKPLSASAVGAPCAQVVAIVRPTWSAAQLAAPDDAVAKEVAAELARWLPGAEPIAEGARLHRFPAAWPRFEVGRYRGLARLRALGAELRAAGRRLYFAGDYLAGPTLEGAVASGLRAADELLADLG